MYAVESVTDFENLADIKFVLLTTFRKDGTPVSTPVCHAVERGIIYTTTLDNTGKARRIRNNDRVQVSACDAKGNITGPTYDASARILTDDELARTGKLKHSRLLGTIFTFSARAHWIVRPMQVYERARFRHRFIGIAIEPVAATDVAGDWLAAGEREELAS